MFFTNGGKIMAKCPKCGYKLKFTDWKPNCPKCGINLNYYGLEEKLQEEADVAEVEHAKIQKKIDRLKASFVGSPLTIARIFLSVLPLGMLMLPLCKLSYTGPSFEAKGEAVNIVKVYNTVSSLDFDALTTLMRSGTVGKGFIGYAVSMIAILLSAVMLIVSLIAICAAMDKKGNIRNIANNTVSLTLAVVSAVFFMIFSKNIHSVFPDLFSGSLGIGAFLYIGALVLLLGINIYLTIHKVEVKYKPCDVGGIPIEEYLAELEKGTSIEELHERMNVILAEREAVRLEETNRKLAEKKAREEEEFARKAGKLK
jgi:hypothetical protein